jgi:hypothetical protein
VQHVRDAAQPSRGDRRRHHVAAHAEHDVGAEGVDDAETGSERHGDDRRQDDVLPQRVAVQPADVDGRQLEPGSRDQALLGTARAPDQQQGTVRFLSAKGSGDCEGGIKVPAGPAARYQKAHLSSV